MARGETIGAALCGCLLAAGCASTSTGAGVQPAVARLLVESSARETARALASAGYLRLQIEDAKELLRGRAAAAQRPADAGTAARAALLSSQESYRKLRFEDSVQVLGRAEAALAEVAASAEEVSLLGQLAFQRALGLLALEQRDAAQLALSQAFALGEKGPAPGQLPPRVETFISEARAALAAAGLREQHVETTPAGARVLVDGKEAGSGPVRLRLGFGLHHLRAEALGYRGRGQLVEAGKASVRLELAAAPAAEVAEQLLARGEPIARSPADPRLLAVVLDAAPAQARPLGWLTVSGSGGDHRAELLWFGDDAAPARLRCQASTDAALADCLGAQLYLASTGQPLQAASPAAPRRPFYRTWWFWTIAGGVVAAAVTAGAVVGARRSGVKVSIESLPSGR